MSNLKTISYPKNNKEKLFRNIKNLCQKNTNSDYTEKIKILDESFNYKINSKNYWSFPELSVFHGTPLYQEASQTQKIALNHIYWSTKYNKVSVDETSTIVFNSITSSVFDKISDFKKISKELNIESSQEYIHVHAFRKIGRMTNKSLIGRKTRITVNRYKGSSLDSKVKFIDKLSNNYNSLLLPNLINKLVFLRQNYDVCDYIKNSVYNNSIEIPIDGLIARFPLKRLIAPLLVFNIGSSPFLACHYYALRFIANMMLKNWEYNYVKYFRKLNRNSEFIPAPTSVSYLHLLDESFHTTISKTIAQEFYKFLPKPNSYEKFIANMTIRFMLLNMDGLSAAMPYRFVKDEFSHILFLYKLLRSSVFDMSHSDAMYWLEKCLCEENENFHNSYRNRNKLLSNLHQVFDSIEYLRSANRKYSANPTKSIIKQSIQNNIIEFNKFSRLIAH